MCDYVWACVFVFCIILTALLFLYKAFAGQQIIKPQEWMKCTLSLDTSTNLTLLINSIFFPL